MALETQETLGTYSWYVPFFLGAVGDWGLNRSRRVSDRGGT